MTKLTYKPTILENWVSRFYRNNGLLNPDDLYISDISHKLDICVTYDRPLTYSFEQDNLKLININYELPTYKQREAFFHELCHIIRHTGNQMMMPEAFRELQERDAQHFTIYASIPFHMLTQYKLKDDHVHWTLADDFNVPVEIARERVERIYRNATKKQKMYA
ncbi:ImmA/IrrE family metallo-endopeptidase [Alkalibacillus haloalkaliphilus]|uniref:ImmA/IrrE family metallo-endopeptidase n=1 Tax=Alkalibacillus haloalkaliphilus TaxID=94136 RepID=UPI00031916CA|nr:ImmA/IrrE family metallo-endopeptidase [Alkalibacillus haloalkaliphilus]